MINFKLKHYILILLVPLSEAKALFYNSNEKVSWYLFSDHSRFKCNVIEDYSNLIIMSTIFYYIRFVKLDLLTKNICLFLFVLTLLDLIHLGLMDLEYFICLKLLLAYFILSICSKLKSF